MKRLLGAAAGIGVPGSLFFSSYPPPLFPGVGFITAALSTAIWAIVSFGSSTHEQTPPPNRRRAAKCSILFAACLITAHILLLQFTTLRVPSDSTKRVQIGFGTEDWSLTAAGRAWKQSKPGITAFEIASNEAAFDQDRVPKAWETWSVYAAGFSLIVLYLAGFSYWARGFALLGIRDGEKDPAQRED